MRISQLLQATAAGCALALQLAHPGCSLVFHAPLRVVEKEEVRLPPPDQVPLFTDPPIHAGTPGRGHAFGAALAAGHISRAVAGNQSMELAIGVPGASNNAGKVVRILKTEAGQTVMDEIVPGSFWSRPAKSRFGAALAVGDFDGDGIDDLAIGAPELDTLGDGRSHGGVFVVYGGPSPQQWDALWPLGDLEGRRQFGFALASGDFDGDGADDLVVGEPGSDRGGGAAARVWVYWGTPGSRLSNTQRTEIAIPAGDEQNNRTRFGASLAVGNFVPSRSQPVRLRPDIAVGAPRYDRPDNRDVGRVYVFRPGQPDVREDGFELAVTLEPQNGWEAYARQFGHALAAGNFNGDTLDGEDAVDLAIGAPASSIPESDGFDTTFGQPSGRAGQAGAGLVFIASYRATGVSAPLRVLSQDRMGLSQKSDNFGWALAAGDFNRDGVDDLAIGSPNERMATVLGVNGVNGVNQAGAIFFRFGNAGDWDALVNPGGIPSIPIACFDYIDAVRGSANARAGDRFGSVLLAAFFDADDAMDLIVGAPDTDVSSPGGVVKDAGVIWIGLNRETRPGPFDGTFTGPFRDDACEDDEPATMTMDVRNREDAVCGVLQTSRRLCFDVSDEDHVFIERFEVAVIASNLGDATEMHLEYELRKGDGDSVGRLSVDASVEDADSDLTLDLRFVGRGDAKGVERSIEGLVLERQ